jgi:exopolysaccharide biosynthesis WecB/TagA/CpsF family protein
VASILGAFLALGGTAFAGFACYLLTLAVAAIGYRGSSHVIATGNRLVVLVPAHDEERLVARCVTSLLKQTYPRDFFRVVVIADNCTDETAKRATRAGAEVMVRTAPDARGKGQALRWAIDRVLAEGRRLDAVVVVDADSIADPEMLASLERELAAGYPVVQGDYRLLRDQKSPGSEMVAAGFALFHGVRFAGRTRLGLAVNLVGNGMLFSRSVLERYRWNAFSGVEDLEYSIRLRLGGIKPRFAAGAVVSGPGPATRAGVARQRLRWEGGRFNVVRHSLARLVAAGLFDAALDLATPPLGLLAIATIAGTCISALAAAMHLVPAWSLVPWLVATAAIPLFVIIGLRAAGTPGIALRVIRGAPRYLLFKLATYLRLARGFDPDRWDRSDRAAPAARRLEIAGVPIDTVDMAGALERLREAVRGGRPFQVSTINLDFVVRAQRDPEIRRIFHRSDLNLADGAPVVWLARLLGAEMPARVAGADLVPALMADPALSGSRVFLLGGEDGVASIAAARFLELYPGIQIAGTYEPPRASVHDMDNAEILRRIEAAKPDVLLVAFGNPKQEHWIDMHRDRLAVSVAIGVGCVFDLVAGRTSRAPRWMQDAGLEWLYRTAREPRRLAGRYITDAVWLVPITLKALRQRVERRRLVEAA